MKKNEECGNVRVAQSVLDLLEYRFQASADKTAFVCLGDGETESDTVTYGELARKIFAVAAALQARDLAGKHILLLYPSGIDFITAFFGCLFAKAVPVPAYPPRNNQNAGRIGSILLDAGVTAVMGTSATLKSLFATDALSGFRDALQVVDTESLDPALAAAWQRPEIGGSDLAFLQYTSGSTGNPKGVMITHANIVHNVSRAIGKFGICGDDTFVSWLPVFHDMGLIGMIIGGVYTGVTEYLMPSYAFIQKPARWLQAVTKYRASISGAPNFAYDLCAEKIPDDLLPAIDLSSLRLTFCGAEPVRKSTFDRFVVRFGPCGFNPKAFYPCYGLAEATLCVSSGIACTDPVFQNMNPRDRASAPGSVGQAASVAVSADCGTSLQDTDIAVVDPVSLRLCPDGQIGEIWVKGPGVARGYWQKEQETRETFGATIADNGQGPYLRTGDLGALVRGHLFVTGRLKDLIIIRGRNIYPQDIESAVQQASAAFAPNAAAAFSVTVDGTEKLVIAQEIRRTSLRNFDAEQAVRSVRQIVAEEFDCEVYAVQFIAPLGIPKTSSGKIQRAECRKQFLEKSAKEIAVRARSPVRAVHGEEERLAGAPERLAPGPRLASVKIWLTGQVARSLQVPTTALDTALPLSQYGIDSVKAVEIAAELEAYLGVPLAPTLLYDYPSIDSLSGYLSGHAPETLASAAAAENPRAPASRDIAIVGMACRFPGSTGLDEFWTALKAGRDCITEVPTSRWHGSARDAGTGSGTSRFGGFLDDVAFFDPLFFNITPREAAAMDPQQRLLLETAWEALEHAGIRPSALKGTDTGVFVGISNPDYSRLGTGDHERLDAYAGTGNAFSIAANRLSYFFDLRGPSWAVDAACSSSLVAVHNACESLRCHESDGALAGGVNLILKPEVSEVFSRAGMLSPDGRCKAFDARADGYVRSEGCGVVVLKRLADAIAAGNTIYAVIRGSAVYQDGKSNGLTAPNGPAQQYVVRKALERAGTRPEDISYLEAHGTGTPLGDPIEFNALKSVFSGARPAADPCYLASVKSNIGHCESAAGIAGLIKTALVLRHHTIPPQIHYLQANPLIDFDGSPFAIPTALTSWPDNKVTRLAGVSSFGFGGTNAHVVVSSYPAARHEAPSPRENGYLFVLSAKTDEQLVQSAKNMLAFLEEQSASGAPVPFRDVIATLQTGREHFKKRIACVVSGAEPLRQALREYTCGQELPAGDRTDAAVQIYHEAAALWLNEAEVDWGSLYATPPPRPTALPHYPFSRQSYWLGDGQAKTGSLAHPYLSRNISTLSRYGFLSEWNGDEPLFTDHQIAGTSVFPAAGFCETARAAAASLSGKAVREINNIRFLKPLVFHQDAVALHCVLDRSGAELLCRFTSGAGGDATVHARCSVVLAVTDEEARLPEPADIRAVFARCPRSETGADLYREYDALGFSYGKSFRTVRAVNYSEHESIAALELADGDARREALLELNPGLLDGAMQSLLPLVKASGANSGQGYLPGAIGKIILYRPLPSECYVIGTADAQRQPEDRILNFNLNITDAEGRSCVFIQALELHPFALGGGIFRPVATSAGAGAQEIDAAAGHGPLLGDPDQTIIQLIAQSTKIPVEKLDRSSRLDGLGIDSMMSAEILDDLEKQTGKLPDTLFLDYPTIGALSDYIGSRSNPVRSETAAPSSRLESIDDFPELSALRAQRDLLREAGIENPYFKVQQGVCSNKTVINGVGMVNYASYNYLGLSGTERINRAAAAAISAYGTSVSASRLATGERPLHQELEREIAGLIGTEDAVVMVSGHATNVTTIGHLMRPQDLIVYDALSHNSIIEGCVLSGARRIHFAHNDWRDLDRILEKNAGLYQRILIAVEGVYSMDGDIPDLPDFIAVKKKHGALLLIDEAHSLGVIGRTGRGIREHFDLDPTDVDLWMGTLSKSLASCGGYIAGSGNLVDYLKYTTPGFVYSVGMSPPNAAAALEAIRVMREEPARVRTLQENSRFFLESARASGLNTGQSSQSAIIPIITGNSAAAMLLAQELAKNLVNVQPITYPAVAEDQARLRFFITSDHTRDEIAHTVGLVHACLAKISQTSVHGA